MLRLDPPGKPWIRHWSLSRTLYELLWMFAGACASSPCAHGGTCVLDGDEFYSCQCVEGFTSFNCDMFVQGPYHYVTHLLWTKIVVGLNIATMTSDIITSTRQKELQKSNVFSRACLSVSSQGEGSGWGPHVTITHGAFYLTVRGPLPNPVHLDIRHLIPPIPATIPPWTSDIGPSPLLPLDIRHGTSPRPLFDIW